ncbi:MAG: hypothetical protein KA004_19020 [Verrucomicrobiales bacterium]|nr:hypothetical protein [Verrucomicrobiales bacterium]
MITKEQIKKAASMWDSKMSWRGIADTLGVTAGELRAACEAAAGKALRDWPESGDTARMVSGFRVVRRELPVGGRTAVARLAAALEAGDCVEGIGHPSFGATLKKYLTARGLTTSAMRRGAEKKWDFYVLRAAAPPSEIRRGK